jgi:hypothetical protein
MRRLAMGRYAVREGHVIDPRCFEATVLDTRTGCIFECVNVREAQEVCDALNANELYQAEINRLRDAVKMWREAHEAALVRLGVLMDEMDELRKELAVAHKEIERLRAKEGK